MNRSSEAGCPGLPRQEQGSSTDLGCQLEALREENDRLRRDRDRALAHIRAKVNQMLEVMGTVALRPEELDDSNLVDLDSIGILGEAFSQVLDHLHETNEALEVTRDELRAIFDSAGVGILFLDRDLRVLAYDWFAQKMIPEGGVLRTGQLCREMLCGQSVAARCSAHKAIEEQTTVRVPDWVFRDRHYDVVATPILGEEGSVEQVVVVYLDITDREAPSRPSRPARSGTATSSRTPMT